MDATLQFIDSATQVPDARIGLVSCDPVTRLPQHLRQRLGAHYAVRDISTAQLLHGVEKTGRQFGGIDTVLGMLEQIQVSLGEIRDHLGIQGVGAEAANNFRDKAVMKTALRNAGLPCARHALVSDLDRATGFANDVGFPLIVKPPDGAGAKGTFRCENFDDLQECFSHLRPSSENPVVMEEFIVGKEHSFDSICLNGKLVWSSISHYTPGPLEVVREPWIQWCVMIPRETESAQYAPIRKIAASALRALGLETGLSHMEWFLRPDGSVAISEVGARPPGAQFTTLISYAHDFNLYDAWAELMIHDRFDSPDRKYAAGAAYLRGAGEGKVTAVHGLKEIAKSLGEIVVEAKIPEPGAQPSGTYEGEGYIIVRHPDTHVVENALKKIVSTVQVQLAN